MQLTTEHATGSQCKRQWQQPERQQAEEQAQQLEQEDGGQPQMAAKRTRSSCAAGAGAGQSEGLQVQQTVAKPSASMLLALNAGQDEGRWKELLGDGWRSAQPGPGQPAFSPSQPAPTPRSDTLMCAPKSGLLHIHPVVGDSSLSCGSRLAHPADPLAAACLVQGLEQQQQQTQLPQRQDVPERPFAVLQLLDEERMQLPAEGEGFEARLCRRRMHLYMATQ